MIQSTTHDSEPTLCHVLRVLARYGYDTSFVPLPGGRIGSPAHGVEAPAASLEIEVVRRFEGPTDPGDQAIVIAGRLGDELRGALVLAYGPTASAEEAEVLRQLSVEPELLWHTGATRALGEEPR